MSSETAPRLMNVSAAAEYLGGISRWTLYALVSDGNLQTVKLPGVKNQSNRRRLLFDRADLDAFVEKCKREGA